MGGVFFFLFSSYYEFLAAAFLIDLLYAVPESSLYNFPFPVSLFGLVLFFVLLQVKKRVRVSSFV